MPPVCESIQLHGGSYDFEDFQVIVYKNQLKVVAKKVLCNFSLYYRWTF